MSDWTAYEDCHYCDGQGFINSYTELFDDVQTEKHQCPKCQKREDEAMKGEYLMQQQRDER